MLQLLVYSQILYTAATYEQLEQLPPGATLPLTLAELSFAALTFFLWLDGFHQYIMRRKVGEMGVQHLQPKVFTLLFFADTFMILAILLRLGTAFIPASLPASARRVYVSAVAISTPRGGCSQPADHLTQRGHLAPLCAPLLFACAHTTRRPPQPPTDASATTTPRSLPCGAGCLPAHPVP